MAPIAAGMTGRRLAAAACATVLLALPQVALAQGFQRTLPPVQMGPRQPPVAQPPQDPVETVEADVSTRSVEVTTGFTGHEILVFGAIDNSQQPESRGQDQSGGAYYDVVVVVEGTPYPVVVRRKSDVAGVWINTSSVLFASVPSYYAIASTRPIDQIAGPQVLERHAIGFAHINMTPSSGYQRTFTDF